MEFTGKTVEEAISEGLSSLGITEEEAVVTVVKDATKGLFGKVKTMAVVDVTKKATGAEKAVEFVQNLLDVMDITAKAQLDSDGDKTIISLVAEKSSEIIGFRGEILDAIQTLAGAVANIENEEYKKVVVDCENYRNKREETLINLAHKLEKKATEIRRKVILEPMSAFERRIIHTALSESETVKTESEGKEPNRYVVIIPNDLDEFSKPYNAGKNDNQGRRNGGNRNFKGDRNNRRNGGNNRPRRSGFSEGEKRVKPSAFGTFIGNSLKDKM